MKYGIVLGRFQPFHLAHEAMVHEVIADGLTPIIIIGSSNVLNERNPYTFNQRHDMIGLIFPNIIRLAVPDCDEYNKWYNNVEFNLRCFINDVQDIDLASKLDKSEIVWYINNKEKDRTYFEFNGKVYNDKFYTQIFKDLGYEVKETTYTRLLGFDLSASEIRKNLDKNRHYLDARVYRYLKEIESGKKEVLYYR